MITGKFFIIGAQFSESQCHRNHRYFLTSSYCQLGHKPVRADAQELNPPPDKG